MTPEENKSVEYQEKLLEAMMIVAKKQVESISFDKTVEASVVDASRAQEGIYVVSTGDAKFEAYSTETGYRNNDAVMVTIPQGDYDKQKMIIGKQVNNSNSPLVYKTPFQQFINISNNLIYDSNDIQVGYYANIDTGKFGKCWPLNTEFYQSNCYTGYETVVNNNILTDIPFGLIWSMDLNDTEQKYTRLGLSAQFSTWLNEYDIISGNYGLVLKVTFKCLELTENNTFDKYLVFDSSEFFGDAYNFETYYTQEKLFNLEDFVDYSIVRLELYAYQRSNFSTLSGDSGLDIYGDDFPPIESLTEVSVVSPNIFIKNPTISLGISNNNFETDTVDLLCDSGLTYSKHSLSPVEVQSNIDSTSLATYYTDIECTHPYDITQLELTEEPAPSHYQYHDSEPLGFKERDSDTYIRLYNAGYEERTAANAKLLSARWIHKDSNTEVIATITDDTIPEDYHVYWYRYSLGAPSPDQFAGAHWERFYGINENSDIVTDYVDNIVFYPDVNKSEERLKVLIIKNDDTIQRLIAASNVIIFTNNDEVRSQATLIDANALSIRFEDDEKGHYFLYNETGEIDREADATQIRYLRAVFDEAKNGQQILDIEQKPPLIIDERTSVTWTFPPAGANTMIIPMDAAAQDARISSTNIIQQQQAVGFTIKKQLNNNATENRVRLDVVKDEQNYSAWVDLIFGTAGDNGSDYKIVLTWRDGKNALNLSKDGDGYFIDADEPTNTPEESTTSLIGDVLLYGPTGFIDWPEKAKLNVQWLVSDSLGVRVNEKRRKEVETIDYYYPVFLPSENNDPPVLNYYASGDEDNNHNPDKEDQPNGYYYFIDEAYSGTYGYLTQVNDEWAFAQWTWTEGSENPSGQLYRKCRDQETKNKLTYEKVNLFHGYVLVSQLEDKTYNSNQRYYRKDDNTGQYIYEPNINQDNLDTYYVMTPVDDETGIINSVAEPIELKEKNENTYEKIYYYSTRKRYFIKIKDQYVLDPWETYEDAETYYEPVEAPPTIYKELNTCHCETISNNDSPHGIKITASSGLSMDSLLILQVTLTNFGDYDLVSYYPIALKNGESRENISEQEDQPSWQMTRIVRGIEGADRVRYSSAGETDFKQKPYQIETLVFDNNVGDFVAYRHGYGDETNILQGYWKLLFTEQLSAGDNFYPILQEQDNERIVFDAQYDLPVLVPISIYIPHTIPYGIQFVDTTTNNASIDEYELIMSEAEFEQIKNDPNREIYQNINEEYEVIAEETQWSSDAIFYRKKITGGTVLWTQPILVYESNYPSRTLNKWNGRDIETDNDAGTIVASGFAAGKKERDNTFTGVVLGDWSRSKTDVAITKNTGIYGFNHGAMSYAFKDDGTGFIGKDGSGRIYFDGDKSQIFSSKWVNQSGEPLGMLLDIDDGYLKMQSNKIDETFQEIKDQTSRNNYFKLLLAPKQYRPNPQETNRLSVQLIFDNAKTEKQLSQEDATIIEVPIQVFFADLNAAGEKEKYTYKYKDNNAGEDYQKILGTDNNNVPLISDAAFSQLNTFFSPYNYLVYYYDFQTETYSVVTTGTGAGVITYSQSSNGSLQYLPPPSSRRFFVKQTNVSVKYITLGANQDRYPLSIGLTKNLNQRKFKIAWDGTAYIQDGVFSGNISGATIQGAEVRGSEIYADYLDAQFGDIGGWEIGNKKLSGGETTLDSIQGITTNSINIQTSSISGDIGAILGNNGLEILGIQSKKDSIAIEAVPPEGVSTGGFIRLTAKKDINFDVGRNIYINGETLDAYIKSLITAKLVGYATEQYVQDEIAAALTPPEEPEPDEPEPEPGG